MVTGLVFGKLYFPKSDPLVGVLEAFSIYTVGFIARPIGAAIFGHYGDRIGRKATLIATLLITGLATFAVAFVPGYATIGIWGAVILTVIRFVPGDWSSAASGVDRYCCRWSGRARTPMAQVDNVLATIRRTGRAAVGERGGVRVQRDFR